MIRLEKIKELDRKMTETLEMCASAQLSKEDIRQYGRPVLAIQESWKRKERLKSMFFFTITVAMVAILYESKATSGFISAVAKLGMVKVVLPYWDWTGLHEKDCIFENPYQAVDAIKDEDCKALEDMHEIRRESNVSQDVMADDYLFSSVPVIITDAMSNWKAVKELDFNLKFLSQLYNENPILSNSSVCAFSSREPTLLGLLDSVHSMDNVQAHWGHCKLSAVKVFRNFYERPYFLPGMVESEPTNYVAIGKLTKPSGETEYTTFATNNHQMTWFSQVKGQFKFRLLPHHICKEICSTLEGTLNQGEVLVYCDEMWQLQYTPSGLGESVAISSGGSWND